MCSSDLSRYGVALAFVLLALGLTLVLQHFEADRPTLFLFFAAIVAAAWFGGVGPGCVAAAASLPAGLYFYSEELHSVSITLDNVVLFFFFVVCAMAGGLLSSHQRDANRALTQEIAERRRAEQALADTREKLAHAARLTALGELTASIAHEINQPLAAVMMNASSCRRWLDDAHLDLDEAREAAASVVQDSNRASEVIKRIRALVKRVPAERGAVAINALVDDAMALVERELRRNDIAVRTELAAGLPAVMGDAVQLQQVVLNIVLNAMEAMTNAPARVLDLQTRLEGSEIMLTIADTGAGFEGRDPHTVFDAFVTSKADGLGLGLSICRSIVESHGGHMAAWQREPRGAVLQVALPIEGEA